MSSLTLSQFGDSFWMPVPASENASAVDWLFYFILVVSAIFFVLIVVVMTFFVLRYRRTGGRKAEKTASHSTALELTWSIIPAILVIAFFYYGFRGFIGDLTMPENTMQVNVTAQKWFWTFEYPETGLIYDNDLHVPVDTPIKLVISSDDIIHSFFVPAFRVKKDAVPGRYNKLYFHPIEAGEYDLFCAEYCGTQHAEMIGKVIVHPPGEFEVWMEEALKDPVEDLTPEQFQEYLADPDAFIAANPDLGLSRPLHQRGAELVKSKGCMQCHSVDGTALIGPSFKNVWGERRLFRDGSEAVADENYIRDSILNPQSVIVEGYDPVMPTYQGRLKDREITAIIEYMKTLSD
jgi:cytochrome c oxidase subunit 2